MKKIKHLIKNKAPRFARFLEQCRNIVLNLVPYGLRKNKNYGFHNDLILQDLIKKICSILPIDSFIETGTNKGNTAKFMANFKKDLPIYTCEINKKFFKESRWRLKNYKNVAIFNSSSPEFFNNLLKEGKTGKLPLVFLDAHADNFYWPLLDEVEIVSSRFSKAIILIDDFRVPNRPEFGYDFWTDGRVKIPYSMEAIEKKLDKKSKYVFIYPQYSFTETFSTVSDGIHDSLRGYIVIFKDADEEFKKINVWNGMKNYFISN